MVESKAKSEGKFDLEQVVRDQLALIDSIIEAEGISEQELFTKYQGLYTQRANLREELKVEIEKKAKAEAATELKSTKDKVAAQTKSERAFATEQGRLLKKRLADEEKAVAEATEIWETSRENRLAFEEELVKFMLLFQEEKTRDEANALEEQWKAFKERNANYILNHQDMADEVFQVDQERNKVAIQMARDADEEIAVGAKEWQDRETADKKAAVELREWLELTAEERLQAQREKLFKERAAHRAELLDDWIDIWDEVGNSVVDLGYVISTDLGQNLETALNFGGAFLETMQAVQLALAGTGSWFTVAAKGIGLVTTMLSGGGFEGKNAKRRRELREEIAEIEGSVADLEKRAHIGVGFWGNLNKNVALIQAAQKELADAQEALHGKHFRNRDKWQAAQNRFEAAQQNLFEIEQDQNTQHKIALAEKEEILKARIAMMENLAGDLLGSVTDTIASAMGNYSEGWDKVEDAIERNLMGAIFQGVLDAQMQRHQLEPLVEEYVAFLTNALADDVIDYSENRALSDMGANIELAGQRIRHNAKRILDSAWGFDFDDFFPKEEDVADLATPISPTIDAPEMSTGLTTSIRNITRSQADALSAVFTNISAINGRIADNTLRTADLLETYLPSISGGGMMVQTTDVGGASYVSPEYAAAMALQNANRANG